MASGIYNIFKSEVLKGSIDLENNVIKVALLNNSHVFNPDSTSSLQWSDVSSNEVSGTGYTSGGQALSNQSVVVDNGDDEGVFDADDVVWPSSTITASHAVIYDDTTATKYLIASIDFGQSTSSTNGNFQIQWDAEGIINLN